TRDQERDVDEDDIRLRVRIQQVRQELVDEDVLLPCESLGGVEEVHVVDVDAAVLKTLRHLVAGHDDVVAERRGSIEDAAQGGHAPALGGDADGVDAIEPARLDAADDAATHEERGLRVDVPHLVCDLPDRSEEHTSELQSRENLVCRLLLDKNKLAHATQH